MIDRRLLVHFDWILLIIVFLLVAIGILGIYSAEPAGNSYLHTKQLYWLLIGSVVMIIALTISYSHMERFAYVLYAVSLFLLVLVILTGSSTASTDRWLDLGIISFQPSEFSKITLIIVLARYFSYNETATEGLNLKGLIYPTLFLIAPFLLIAKEPDLGTALILLLIFASMILFVKVRTRTLFALLAVFIAIVPFAWHYLKDYQKSRLLSFLNPSYDSLGSGYHLMQSKIAIGSGGFLGKGMLKGTQGKLLFLPEQHTDFVFSIFAEEWGFIGSFVIIGLYFIVIMWGLNIAKEAKDRFGVLLAYGVTSLIFWHIVINIGMVTGMLPVVGAPLPFLSYGGSFLLASMLCIGILLNIAMRRFVFSASS